MTVVIVGANLCYNKKAVEIAKKEACQCISLIRYKWQHLNFPKISAGVGLFMEQGTGKKSDSFS